MTPRGKLDSFVLRPTGQTLTSRRVSDPAGGRGISRAGHGSGVWVIAPIESSSSFFTETSVIDFATIRTVTDQGPRLAASDRRRLRLHAFQLPWRTAERDLDAGFRLSLMDRWGNCNSVVPRAAGTHGQVPPPITSGRQTSCSGTNDRRARLEPQYQLWQAIDAEAVGMTSGQMRPARRPRAQHGSGFERPSGARMGACPTASPPAIR